MPKDSLEILKYPKFSIFEDLSNTSDHKAINFTIETHTTHDIPNESHKKTNNTLSLENPEILNFFQIKIQENLQEYSDYYKNSLTIQNGQTYIDQLYSSACKIFIISADQTLNFQKTLFPPKNINSNQIKKPWFTPELKEINKKMKNIYNQINININPNPNPILVQEYNNLKKSFRSIQRRNIYLSDLKEVSVLDRISKEKNKNKFRRFLKLIEKKGRKKKKF